MNSSKLFYRAEIDGLRAIAVVSVILYHAQTIFFGKDWFEGGFIGVDIFFVISGFLITRVILSELQSTGSFGFLNFYERRARRILPMLFVVIFASIPFAWHKLLPADFVEYAESILASLFFGSNFFFYVSTTEYGADSSLLKPFLHTWSLGVEEQFYLVFPIIAIVVFNYFRNHFLSILMGLSFLSLLFSEFMEIRNSDLNFYLPFSRFWELAVGSLLAYKDLNYKTSGEGMATKYLPMLGLFLIVYSLLFFDGQTPHPSFHTLIPIIGSTLIIGFASQKELVGKVLGSTPFVWVGLISYSAYLWHFPIFAFSRMGEQLTNYDKIQIITLTFILSIISFFVVERPFRKKINSKVFVFIVVFCLLIISFGLFFVKHTEGLKFRYEYQLNLSLDKNAYSQNHEKFAKKIQSLSRFDDQNINVLFVGNSHARDLQSAFYQNKELLDGFNFKRGDIGQISCFDPNASSEEVKARKEKYYSSSDYEQSDLIVISNRFKGQRACIKNKEVLNDFDGLRSVIQSSIRDGKKVIVFGSNVEFKQYDGRPLLDHKLKKLAEKHGGLKNISPEQLSGIVNGLGEEMYGDIRKGTKKLNVKVKSIAYELGVPFVDKYALSCSDLTKACLVLTPNGDKIFWDSHHFTINGARFIGSILLTDEFIASLRKWSKKSHSN